MNFVPIYLALGFVYVNVEFLFQMSSLLAEWLRVLQSSKSLVMVLGSTRAGALRDCLLFFFKMFKTFYCLDFWANPYQVSFFSLCTVVSEESVLLIPLPLALRCES